MSLTFLSVSLRSFGTEGRESPVEGRTLLVCLGWQLIGVQHWTALHVSGVGIRANRTVICVLLRWTSTAVNPTLHLLIELNIWLSHSGVYFPRIQLATLGSGNAGTRDAWEGDTRNRTFLRTVMSSSRRILHVFSDAMGVMQTELWHVLSAK